MSKLSNEELREQFDDDVDRFSDETTGQSTAVDATLVFEMLDATLPRLLPQAERICDIGCGAGNFAIRIARLYRGIGVTLIDLSRQMLDRAVSRLEANRFVVEKTIQEDILHVSLPEEHFDIVTAAASLHHLRSRDDFLKVYRHIYTSLRPEGVFWMSDLIRHEIDGVETVQKQRYADFLIALKDRPFQEEVFRLIDAGDTPETLMFHMAALRDAGFR
jgi:Methylase involved in ubiquinone/menaquinone biosynthesis